MKFSKRVLLRLKNKNKKLKPDKYKKLKRESVRGLIKGTVERPPCPDPGGEPADADRRPASAAPLADTASGPQLWLRE